MTTFQIIEHEVLSFNKFLIHSSTDSERMYLCDTTFIQRFSDEIKL
jgi:hypothetical protein